jgi:hypothetical protein
VGPRRDRHEGHGRDDAGGRRQRLREGRKPARDVVLTFTADEEAGGTWGARFLVDKHPELFEGVTEAVGEVGGFSMTLGGQRLYLLQTAEKGWPGCG